MTWHSSPLVGALALASLSFAIAACTTARSYDVPPPTNKEYTEAEKTQLANDIRDVIKDRCWGCHGEPGKKAFGNFDYALDYDKLAASDHVDLKNPEKSEVYDLVASGNMPRKMNEDGKPKLKDPLPKAVADRLLEWLRAGAPRWE